MPLAPPILANALMAMAPSPPALPSVEWAKAFGAYAKMSVPGAANPPLCDATALSVITPALTMFDVGAVFPDPSTFCNALNGALVAFWVALIPAALPATPVVVPNPTPLTALFMPASVSCLAAPDIVTATNLIATAIDTWTHLFLYGPVPPAVPAIPLL